MVTDEQCSDNQLPNGVRVISLHEPLATLVGIQLFIDLRDCTCSDDLVNLSRFASLAITRGSTKHPAPDSFSEFCELNDIDFRRRQFTTANCFMATVPVQVVDEFLDRLADMIFNPILPTESVEKAQTLFPKLYTQVMEKNEYRLNQAQLQLIAPDRFCYPNLRELLKSDTLLSRTRDFVTKYYVPRNMTIVTCGSIETPQTFYQVSRTFGIISSRCSLVIPSSDNEKDSASSYPTPVSSPLNEERELVNQSPVVGQVYTENADNRLRVSFRMPANADTSAILYYAYLFSTSQPGSLLYKLKRDGLASSIEAQHEVWAPEVRTLNIEIMHAAKGAANLSRILSLIMGYTRLIRQLLPNAGIFRQATEFFRAICWQDDFFDSCCHYGNILLTKFRAKELWFSEIPHSYSEPAIKQVGDHLTPSHCQIIIVSDEYPESCLRSDQDYPFRYSFKSVHIGAASDGLSAPALDPLMATQFCGLAPTTGLCRISALPPIFQRSTGIEMYTTLNISLRSATFASLSAPIQRIYAAMIDYKMWLRVNTKISHCQIKVVDNAFDISLKSLPDVMPRLLEFLVYCLSAPIGTEYSAKFQELWNREHDQLKARKYGHSEAEINTLFDEMIEDSTSIDKQREQLMTQCININQLPFSIRGKLVLLFGGNSSPDLVAHTRRIIETLLGDPHTLEMKNVEACSPRYMQVVFEGLTLSPPSEQAHYCSSLAGTTYKKALRLPYQLPDGSQPENFAILKAYNLAPFSHSDWASLLLMTHLINTVIQRREQTEDPVHNTSTKAVARRKLGRIWLLITISSSSPPEAMQSYCEQSLSADFQSVVSHMNDDVLESLRCNVIRDVLGTCPDSDEELSRIWESIRLNPDDDTYFRQLQYFLWHTTLPILHEVYRNWLANLRDSEALEIIFEPLHPVAHQLIS